MSQLTAEQIAEFNEQARGGRLSVHPDWVYEIAPEYTPDDENDFEGRRAFLGPFVSVIPFFSWEYGYYDESWVTGILGYGWVDVNTGDEVLLDSLTAAQLAAEWLIEEMAKPLNESTAGGGWF